MEAAVSERPPVSATVRGRLLTLLPDADETLFLQACLRERDAAGEAWDRWRHAAAGDGTTAQLAPFNTLLPLLLWNLRRAGADVAPDMLTRLRSADLTEELRGRRYRAICAEALEGLRAAAVPFVVLKGAALAETVYPAPTLRHADDVDVLVHAKDLARSAAALDALGWRASSPPLPLSSSPHGPPRIHPSGLPLELHHRLVMPYYTLPYERLWSRTRPARVAGVDVAVLSPADTLLHVCAHAILGGRILRWVPDAWFLLARHPDLDWPALVSTTIGARLALPVHHALAYLSGRIGAPVPLDALDTLRAAAARTGIRGRCAAQLAARPWPLGTPRELWAQPGGIGRRLRTLGRRAFPSPLDFALRFGLRWWQVPMAYGRRLLRYARRIQSGT
jgi:hypothetical protein